MLLFGLLTVAACLLLYFTVLFSIYVRWFVTFKFACFLVRLFLVFLRFAVFYSCGSLFVFVLVVNLCGFI